MEYRKLVHTFCEKKKQVETLVPSNNNISIGFCIHQLIVPQDLRKSSPISAVMLFIVQIEVPVVNCRPHASR